MKLLKNKAFIAFSLSFILGLIICLPNIIAGKGIFSLIVDFNEQQIPFNMMINRSLKEGTYLFTWYNELGSNFIATYSFYNLFSPFNIIGYFFSAGFFKYLIGPILILKYGVAGLTSYLFIKRYVKNKNYAIIGSLLYAFSGFQLANTLFYHFHDVVALFPLLLYTLDNLIYDNKKGWLLLSVFLNCMTNWFFFIGEGIFAFIYFIIKVIKKEYKMNLKKFKHLILEVLLGILLSSFMLIPVLLFTKANPRINNSWDIISMFKYSIPSYLEIIKSFLLPSQTMTNRAFINEFNYTSIEAYLPLTGMILVISYCIKNKKDWLTIINITSIIFMFIPILNNIFFLFTRSYYARWIFMPILLFSLTSAKSIDNHQNIKSGIIFTLLGYLILIMGSFIYIKRVGIDNFIFDNNYLKNIIIFAIINLITFIFIYKIKNEKKLFISLIIAIYIFIGIWGNYNIYKYKYNSFKNYLNNDEINGYKLLNKYNDSRSNSSPSCSSNLGSTSSINNIKSFNSNIEGSNFEFYNSIGFSRDVSTKITLEENDLIDYLGVKYYIDCSKEKLENDNYTYLETINTFNIYLNNNYNEFGFNKNKYINKKDFNKLSNEEKKHILHEYTVLDDKQIKKYKDLFNKEITYSKNEFKYTKNGFTGIIESNESGLAIYTIPYDEGFSIKVNGKDIEYLNVDNGMIGIPIKKGENMIEANYYPKGLKLGIIISIISSINAIIYLLSKKSNQQSVKVV